MTSRTFLARLERFGSVDSTQRIVREWLEAGQPEVAIAIADEQTAGRGRQGRSWTAPPGAALLMSIGFRPENMPLRHGWRLAATVSLAMLDAAEAAAGLADNALRLKWPNDIVAAYPDGRLEKVAGVLGETVAVGDQVGWTVVGIGVNVDWSAADFPPGPEASMTSLREMAGRPVDREQLLDEFLARLEPRYEAIRQGNFDGGDLVDQTGDDRPAGGSRRRQRRCHGASERGRSGFGCAAGRGPRPDRLRRGSPLPGVGGVAILGQTGLG